jgi:aliphatic nitrilase
MTELLCTDPGKQQMLLVGGGFARIYAPDGSPLGTNLPEDQEGLVVADIDLGMISLAKAAADPSGHYSRPDVTQLLLNKTRREPVVIRQQAGPSNGAFETVVASSTSPTTAAADARAALAA